MSRPDADSGRRQVDIAGIKDAANKHGGDRRALRRAARYVGMGYQPQPINGGMENLFGQSERPENEGQPKI